MILQLVWVILAYMITSTVLVLTAGRLSDLFGRKQAYVATAFVVFALASRGLGLSPHGTELILWRIVQGVGGAFLFAIAAALASVTDAFPKEQLGPAMGSRTRCRRRRPRPRSDFWRPPRRGLLAVGLLVQRPLRPGLLPSGAAWS